MFRPQSKKNLRPLKAIIKGCAEESALLTKNARKLVKEKKASCPPGENPPWNLYKTL
jgi:hypothetical protein